MFTYIINLFLNLFKWAEPKAKEVDKYIPAVKVTLPQETKETYSKLCKKMAGWLTPKEELPKPCTELKPPVQ